MQNQSKFLKAIVCSTQELIAKLRAGDDPVGLINHANQHMEHGHGQYLDHLKDERQVYKHLHETNQACASELPVFRVLSAHHQNWYYGWSLVLRHPF